MASVAWDYARTGIWRFSRRDAILVALAVLHGVVLAAWPLAPLIAVGVWWNSNPIAHNFIHRPLFRSAERTPCCPPPSGLPRAFPPRPCVHGPSRVLQAPPASLASR